MTEMLLEIFKLEIPDIRPPGSRKWLNVDFQDLIRLAILGNYLPPFIFMVTFVPFNLFLL